MKNTLPLLLVVSLLLAGAAGSSLAQERHLTLLATNDIHGGVEPSKDKFGHPLGGLALWATAVKAIRQGVQAADPGNSGVLVLDAGDQFQGTLISNFDEGQLVFAAMNQIGYDAVIPGNHDYDFGPIGWLIDKSEDATKKREALERLAHQATFPLLSANTFYKDSLKDISGNPIAVASNRCEPAKPGAQVDWSSGKRPEFLQPYLIKRVAGVRVALIGLDNPRTPEVTTRENVDDLCFGDELEVYSQVRRSLASEADIFVILLHDGDTTNEHSVAKLVQKISRLPGGGADAVISGHTHFNYNEKVNGVPLIQSGFGGERFGRIDLVWDTESHKLLASNTKSIAGVRLYPDRCDVGTESFCQVQDGTAAYYGTSLVPDPTISGMITRARGAIQTLAERPLGNARKELTRDRIAESPLSDAISDALRDAAQAEIALVNTGGLRESLPAGPVTYEDLFKVLPFNNHEVVIGPMGADKILSLLSRSAQTCGLWGALMQSGLRVTFQRHCEPSGPPTDDNAKLLHVETNQGEVIFDGGERVSDRSFRVATLDFLMDGGSGFDAFVGTPLLGDLGIAREIMTTHLLTSPAQWTGEIDGRWKAVDPEASR